MERDQIQKLVDSTLSDFSVSGQKYAEYFPSNPDDRDSCFLWSYFALSGMLYFGASSGLPTKEIFKEIIDGFIFYRSNSDSGLPVKYHSERGNEPCRGHGPCFFDDNIWTARNFLFAYELFKDEAYLSEAEQIVEFVRSGWNEDLGGVVWNENGLTENATVQELERGLSANACASLVNAILYRITGKEDYLIWAKRFYDFCKIMQDPETKVYYNGIHTVIENGHRKNGNVNRDMYSYNSGSMILADLELYRVTRDACYLEDAKATSDAAYKAFLLTECESGMPYIDGFIWFTAVLAEGWYALKELGNKNATKYLKTLADELDYSYRFIDSTGLLPHNLVSGWRGDDYDRMLLSHSGIAEIAILCNK